MEPEILESLSFGRGLTPEKFVSLLLGSHINRDNFRLTLYQALEFCQTSTNIIQSKLSNFELQSSHQNTDYEHAEELLMMDCGKTLRGNITQLSCDTLFNICEYTYQTLEKVRLRLTSKSLHLALMGCPIDLIDANIRPTVTTSDLVKSLSPLRLHHHILALPPHASSNFSETNNQSYFIKHDCNCHASRALALLGTGSILNAVPSSNTVAYHTLPPVEQNDTLSQLKKIGFDHSWSVVGIPFDSSVTAPHVLKDMLLQLKGLRKCCELKRVQIGSNCENFLFGLYEAYRTSTVSPNTIPLPVRCEENSNTAAAAAGGGSINKNSPQRRSVSSELSSERITSSSLGSLLFDQDIVFDENDQFEDVEEYIDNDVTIDSSFTTIEKNTVLDSKNDTKELVATIEREAEERKLLPYLEEIIYRHDHLFEDGEYLDADDYPLIGDIKYLQSMTTLKKLKLSENDLEGLIETYFHFNRNRNQFLFTCSDEYGHVRKQTFSSANVFGNIHGLSSLTSLVHLDLSYTKVCGNLSSFQGLKQLEYLDLSQCTNINGNIEALKKLTYLKYLSLRNLVIHGSLSSMHGLYKSIEYLDLKSTLISGGLFCFKFFSKLRYIDLSTNENIEGDITFLGNLKKLVVINLSRTKVYGEINSLIKLSNLSYLKLFKTQVDDWDVDFTCLAAKTNIQNTSTVFLG